MLLYEEKILIKTKQSVCMGTLETIEYLVISATCLCF